MRAAAAMAVVKEVVVMEAVTGGSREEAVMAVAS